MGYWCEPMMACWHVDSRDACYYWDGPYYEKKSQNPPLASSSSSSCHNPYSHSVPTSIDTFVDVVDALRRCRSRHSPPRRSSVLRVVRRCIGSAFPTSLRSFASLSLLLHATMIFCYCRTYRTTTRWIRIPHRPSGDDNGPALGAPCQSAVWSGCSCNCCCSSFRCSSEKMMTPNCHPANTTISTVDDRERIRSERCRFR